MKSAPKGYFWIGKKADLEIYLTFVGFNHDDDIDALYIRNEKRRNDQGGSPAVIVLETELWQYRPEDRDRGRFHNIDQMNEALGNACVALYGLDTLHGRFNIHDAILEFAPDLVKMKPRPNQTRAEWVRAMERNRIDIKVNGKSVL